ncbi:MAG: SpoIID/LytB domain-containing protein [Acidobacteria bacterium]|nr:SpoIID/LytB domain-containing protein [Acidobacteriota bacterium]
MILSAPVCVCVAILFAWSPPAPVKHPAAGLARHRASEAELDAALQRAAALALDGRDGTVVVMDAQDGRLRAVVNEGLAGLEAFPPGSAVKPFTLLAALREKIVNADTRLLCRKHFERGGTEFTCSHPVYKTLFDPAHALAHSCNYFFANLGERIDPADFNATLASFGFGAARVDGGEATRARLTDPHAHSRSTDADPRPSRAARNAFESAHRATDRAATVKLAPRLPARGAWRTETALGEGGAILATPLQMISAYSALVNGGRLFDARRAAPENFDARESARVHVSPEERALVVGGMRGAISYGTAERARLDELPLKIFGKTGTATEIGGFRTHGWFVGFATIARASAAARDAGALYVSPDEAQGDQPAPRDVKLAVLVFLRRARGKQCAEIARPVFEEFARLAADADEETPQAGSQTSEPDREPAGTSDDSFPETADQLQPQSSDTTRDAGRGDATIVRVRIARDGETRAMPLDDYLFGVLAAEGSTEDEFAAVKALAVASRTYALQKLGRHARDGYDFCTTTHCQRYLRVTPDNARPDFHALLRRAVSETAGEVLRDSRGRLASAYFSASCGGVTANVQTLWGTAAREPYERGVADEYCAALPHSRWADAIPARQLLAALREDPRSDVGSRLDNVSVVKRDATGRAETIELGGERRKVLRGWDFKIIVGRTLGWNLIKSSRFNVSRAGSTFIFRGSGFGHGLGLCQAGAHVMARGGSTYTQILAHYFPGATVGRATSPTRARAEVPTRRAASYAHYRAAPPRAAATPARATLSSEHFRITYPARGSRSEAESALRTLEAARRDLARRLDAASLSMPALPPLDIHVHETTADFVAATGYPAWVAAASRGSRVETQPLATLERRGVVTQTLRHEFVHPVIEKLSRGRAPAWLAEGLAAHFAGEGAMLARSAPLKKIPLEELERRLAEVGGGASEMRSLYAAAYAEVRALLRSEGESQVWRRVADQ